MANWLEETKNLILQREKIEEGGPRLYDYIKRLVGQLESICEELASSINFQNKYIQPDPARLEALRTSTFTASAASTWESIPFDWTGINEGKINHSTNTDFVFNEKGCYKVDVVAQMENTRGNSLKAVAAFRATLGGSEIIGSEREQYTDKSDDAFESIALSFLVCPNVEDTMNIQFYTENTNLVLSPDSTLFDESVAVSINIVQIANQ